ncbi:MAG: hypothetical protein IJ400_05280 [Clostridia bacterium]|nr:hypothetical protein [Clostridia bacterium]
MEYNQSDNNQIENNSQANSNINYVLNSFEELKDSYEKTKKIVSKEMLDLWEMISYERKQADVFRKKVQAGDVMRVILPFLSDIVNDVEEATDTGELKRIIGIYIKSMSSHLKSIGVELKIHSENDILDPTERVGGACRMTGDKSLDGKIIKTTQIGCIIHNEEPEEIQENVLVYKYDPELDLEKTPEVEAEPELEEASEVENEPEVESEPEVENEPKAEEEEPIFKLYDDPIQIITPVDDTPAEDTPAEDTPAEETPAEDTPADEIPVEDTPVEETPVEDKEPTIKATIDENGKYLLCECFRIESNLLMPYTRKKPFELNQGYPYTFKPHSVVSMYVGELCILPEYKTQNVDKQLRACVVKMNGKVVFCIKEGKDIIAQIDIII